MALSVTRRWSCVLFALLAIVGRGALPASIGAAQERPDIEGTVADVTGGVIVGATVELTRGGQRRTTRTDDRGRYRFDELAPGEYDVLVTHDGFNPAFERLSVAGPVTHDVVLQVLVKAEVHVLPQSGGDLPALATRVISGVDLDALPTEPGALRRQLWELAGATGRPGDLAMYVDGFRQTLPFPPASAIQMIRINANPFAAEFAEPGRTRIEITTKPGSDGYRGELRVRFNDSALNARHVFAPSRAPVQTRTYTGYLSGPIIPRRWSLVLYGGRWEQKTSEVVHATVLDADTLQAEHFSREVLTPKTTDNLWLGTDYRLTSQHILALTASRTREEALNQGLDRGLDLPERAYTSTGDEQLGRLALTSTFTPRLLGELRVEAGRSHAGTQALTDAPAVMVLDAFAAGGNQAALLTVSRIDRLRLVQDVTVAAGRSTFKAGVMGEATRERHLDRRQFGGTFVFGTDLDRDAEGAPLAGEGSRAARIDPLEVYRRTLLARPGYGPSQFSIGRGDPELALSDAWGAAFAQGDWMPTPRLTLSYGLRQEIQQYVRNAVNLAPRLGLAWTPDGRASTLRAGAGVFYDRVPTAVVLDTRRFDGQRRQRLVVRDPSFFPDVPEDLPEAAVRAPTVYVLDPGVEAPRALLTSVSYERRLRTNLSASLGYSYERGEHLLRTRSLVTPAAAPVAAAGDGVVLQYESSARSRRHEVLAAVRTNWTGALRIFANYTWSSSRSDTDGPSTAPADSGDLTTEFGRTDTDARHRGSAGVTLRLPGQLLVSATGVMASGRPFNITTGRDDNGDTLFTDRPAFADPADPDAIVTPFGSFTAGPGAGDRVIPRNFGRGPGELRVDLHVSRSFRVGPGGSALRMSADVVNLFNRANVTGINGVVTSPAFGRATRAREARRVDLSMGVTF